MTDAPDESVPTTQTCVHHWMLSSPVGGTTSGLCRDCGAVRDFVELAKPVQFLSRGRRKWPCRQAPVRAL